MTSARGPARARTRRPAPRRERHPVRVPQPEPAAAPEREPPASIASRLGRVFGAVVAPTTLFTALFYYFGWMHAYYFFGYFGVHSTLLGFTPTDYLMRSVDALLVPVAVAALAVLAGLWLDGVLLGRLAGGSRELTGRIAVVALGALATLLVAGCAIATFTYTNARNEHPAVFPLGFALGVLLVAYVRYLRERLAGRARERGAASVRRPWAGAVAWAAVFLLVGMSLFAAATDYAAATGQARAQREAATLGYEPNVLVYSEKNLGLRAPGVHMVRCTDPEAAYKFRYEGLKLVLQSGGLNLFLPEAWTPEDGVAFLVPRSDSIRLEFYSGPVTTDPC
jgi:hypothetical protein